MRRRPIMVSVAVVLGVGLQPLVCLQRGCQRMSLQQWHRSWLTSELSSRASKSTFATSTHECWEVSGLLPIEVWQQMRLELSHEGQHRRHGAHLVHGRDNVLSTSLHIVSRERGILLRKSVGRGNYFLNRWVEAESPHPFCFKDVAEAYPDSFEWIVWLCEQPIESDCCADGMEIQGLIPDDMPAV